MASYVTKQGDMFDSIAYEIFGDCIYSKAIADENPEFSDVSVFSDSIALKLPDPDRFASNDDLPPWRRIAG